MRRPRKGCAKVRDADAYGYKNVARPGDAVFGQLTQLCRELLRMSFGYPTEPYVFHDEITRALDVLLILHADHEQNCSTSTVRLIGSSGANIYASVAGGVNALSGPRTPAGPTRLLSRCCRQGLRDLGHRIRAAGQGQEGRHQADGLGTASTTTIRAPRSSRHADVGHESEGRTPGSAGDRPELEQAALGDDFTERKLYPNVDFYSGLIYEAMGFRRRCSPSCSRSVGCPAGSPSGASCGRIRKRRSDARARSTSGSPGADLRAPPRSRLSSKPPPDRARVALLRAPVAGPVPAPDLSHPPAFRAQNANPRPKYRARLRRSGARIQPPASC